MSTMRRRTCYSGGGGGGIDGEDEIKTASIDSGGGLYNEASQLFFEDFLTVT